MKWYQNRIGRFENLSDLIWSFLMEFYLVIILLIALLFCTSDKAEAVTFTCSNKTSWESKSDKTYDFYTTPIRPDGSPNYSLDFADQLDTFYDGDEYILVVNGSSKCFAAVNCLDASGYDFTKPFDSNHPAWKNYNQCTCTHRPQAGCNAVTWHRKKTPSVKSGPVGSKFPVYPTPTYPANWSKRAVYKHGFKSGTSSSNIKLNILANIDTKYLRTGTKASVQDCGSGSKTVGGKEVVLRYFIVKGLKTFDQTFNATQPYQEWNQDWGICGKVKQYWNESNRTYSSRPAQILDIPVLVFVSKAGEAKEVTTYDYKPKPRCAGGGVLLSNKSCRYSHNPDSKGECRSGFTYKFGMGGSSTCTQVSASSNSYGCGELGTGWSENPKNSSECQKKKKPKPPEKIVTPAINPKVDKPPDDSKVPPWCTARGDSWNGKNKVCTKGNVGGSGGSGGSGEVQYDYKSLNQYCKSGDRLTGSPSSRCYEENNRVGNSCPTGYSPTTRKGVEVCYRFYAPFTNVVCKGDWEIDPENSSQCRMLKTGNGVGGSVGSGSTKDKGGKKVDKGSGGKKDTDGKKDDKKKSDSDLTADSFFKNAPVARPGDIGSGTLGKDGFYKPTYGPKESFTTLLDGVWKKSGVEDMTEALDGLAPPVFKAGGLPTICLPLSFLPKGDTLCFKFSDYSFVFDVIKMFFYFVAVMTSWRIIIGAK